MYAYLYIGLFRYDIDEEKVNQIKPYIVKPCRGESKFSLMEPVAQRKPLSISFSVYY